MNNTKPPAFIDVVYKLGLKDTETGVGYFSCGPIKEISFEESIEYLRAHPYDTFMHKYLLDIIAKYNKTEVAQLVEEVDKNDYTLLALLYETSLLYNKSTLTKKYFESKVPNGSKSSEAISLIISHFQRLMIVKYLDCSA